MKSIAIIATMTLAALLGHANAIANEAPAATPAMLAARLQRLEDIEAIRLLLDRYLLLNETRDYPAYSQLFAANGELVLRRGRATGPDAILKLLNDSFGAANAAPNNPLNGSKHLLSNVAIHVDGDTATASSRWTLLTVGTEQRPALAQTGHYADKLVRENGVWKFQQRIISRDIPSAAPAN